MNLNVSMASLTTSAMLALSMPIIADNIVPQVFHIESLSQVSNNHPPKTLFLFDIDDTIFDSFSMLGSKAWRRYIVEATKKIDPSENWHDIFSYALAQKHPLRAVEEITSSFVKDLQSKEFVVCGFTSRERKLWYEMSQEDVDVLTVQQLSSIDVNFNNGSVENIYPNLARDSEYFNGGFFANIESKGNYLLHLFKTNTLLPEKIVFIDDKLSQVESVANALAELGISHESYLYLATDIKGKSFDPLIANIQLYYFYDSNGEKALSDEEAKVIAISNPEKDANHYLTATLSIAKAQLSLNSLSYFYKSSSILPATPRLTSSGEHMGRYVSLPLIFLNS